MSVSPEWSLDGVPTAKKIKSASLTTDAKFSVNEILLAATFFLSKSSRPSSYIVGVPVCNISTLEMLLSTQTTEFPSSAKHTPVTRPTYPVPTITIFIFHSSVYF